MSHQDITTINPQALRQYVQSPSPQQGSVPYEKVAQVAANMAAQMVERRQHEKQSAVQAYEKRSAIIKNRVRNSLEKISTWRVYQTLHDAGYQIDAKVVEQLPHMKKVAMAEMKAIEDKVMEAKDAEDYLMEELIDAAESDPETAADLISAESGEDVAADDVEEAADEVADVIVKSELGEGGTKESAAKYRRIEEWSKNLSPFAADIIANRATYKASQVLEHLRSQAQGHR